MVSPLTYLACLWTHACTRKTCKLQTERFQLAFEPEPSRYEVRTNSSWSSLSHKFLLWNVLELSQLSGSLGLIFAVQTIMTQTIYGKLKQNINFHKCLSSSQLQWPFQLRSNGQQTKPRRVIIIVHSISSNEALLQPAANIGFKTD